MGRPATKRLRRELTIAGALTPHRIPEAAARDAVVHSLNRVSKLRVGVACTTRLDDEAVRWAKMCLRTDLQEIRSFRLKRRVTAVLP